MLNQYFRDCADDHGIRKNIRFNTTVDEARYDEEQGSWQIRVSSTYGRDETLTARAIITAMGQLNRPKFPEITGIESFEGISFHSGEWEHDHDLTGKRIAVIGTGASAFQFVPEIADRVGEMFVFQRSAPWMAPTPNYHDEVEAGMKWLLKYMPFYEKWYRFWLFWMMTDGVLPMVTADPTWNGGEQSISAMNDLLRIVLTEHIENQIPDDPELRAAAVPDYPVGGKRMLRDNGVWLSTLQRDNVQLICNRIREITPTGIVTEDGEEREVDVIIYGTGFKASEFLSPIRIVGRDGIDLESHWAGDARAYLGITVPGFPNLFCMYGPNTNIVVNGSIIFFSECEIRYILGCIGLLIEGDHRALDCKESVHDVFNRSIDEGNAKMAWGVPQVNSWYKNAKGRVAQNWPFSLVEYWNRTRTPNPDDFHFE